MISAFLLFPCVTVPPQGKPGPLVPALVALGAPVDAEDAPGVVPGRGLAPGFGQGTRKEMKLVFFHPSPDYQRVAIITFCPTPSVRQIALKLN